MNRLGYSLDEVADLLGVSRRTVERQVQAGKLPSFTVGRARRVRARAVHELVEGDRPQAERPTPDPALSRQVRAFIEGGR